MKQDEQGKKGGGAMAQQLDPTHSGEDFMGDTTGLAGVTTDNAQKTSRTPKARFNDQNKDHLASGIMHSNPSDDHGRRLSPESYDHEEYDKNINKQMSPTKAAVAEELASEDEKDSISNPLHTDPEVELYQVNKKDASGDDSPGTDDINTASATYYVPEHLGEQSISGSAPDPTADDDTLEAAQAMGTQLDEDEEHPQELDIARDIDTAEESLRTNH